MTTPTQDKKGSTSPGQGDEHMFDTSLGSPTFESPIREQPADGAAAEADSSKPAQLSPEEIEKMKDELEKVENEIVTLRQVLGSKVRYATELKRKLGITPFQELKQDIQYGIKSIKDSETFQKTNEKIHDINDKLTHSSAYQKTSNAMKTASEKTNAVVSSIGASVSKKIGDIKNSQTFKSMEEKVGGAYSNVKAKVTGSKSEGSFEEALASEKQESGANGDTPSNLDSLPEEKVPL